MGIAMVCRWLGSRGVAPNQALRTDMFATEMNQPGCVRFNVTGSGNSRQMAVQAELEC
jgi:hypothetical protein